MAVELSLKGPFNETNFDPQFPFDYGDKIIPTSVYSIFIAVEAHKPAKGQTRLTH